MAEDIIQEVFLAVLREDCGFDPERGTLSGYLFGIARKLILRQGERGRTSVTIESDSDEATLPELAVDDDPLLDLTHREGIEALRRAVQALPRRYREVVVLCDLEEKTYEQAAAAVECAVGTVRSRLHRARALLARKLKQDRNPRRAVTADRGEVHIMNCQEFWNTLPELAAARNRIWRVPRLCVPHAPPAELAGGSAPSPATWTGYKPRRGRSAAPGAFRNIRRPTTPFGPPVDPGPAWAAALAAMIAIGLVVRARARAGSPRRHNLELAMLELRPTQRDRRRRPGEDSFPSRERRITPPKT